MTSITRRTAILATASLFAPHVLRAAPAKPSGFDFSFTSLEGDKMDFAQYRGRVLLVVNTASFCGYTYQYEGLEKLHAALTPHGLTVVGMPSQDFDQESASNQAVKEFCDATFGVQFPMTEITHVRGAAANPFYKWVKAQKDWEPSWNFNKVLIGRDGQITQLFRSDAEPQGSAMTGWINKALQAPARTV